MVLPAPSARWPYQPSILVGQPEHMLPFMPLHSLPHAGSVLTFILTPEGYLGLLPQKEVQPTPSSTPLPHDLERGSKSTYIL